MAELVIIVELPVGSAHDIDTTELALLLRDVKAANIIDYGNSSELDVTPIGSSPQYSNEPMYDPDNAVEWQQF